MSFFKFHSDEAHFFLVPFRLWEMSLGVFLFLEQDRIKKLLQKAGPFFEIYVPLALASAFFIKYSPNSFPFPILTIILPAVIYVIVFSKEESSSKLDMVLNSSVLSFFGTISYSLYLIHWPVVVFIKYAFGKSFVPMAIGLLVSILISYFITHKFEIPINTFIRKKRTYVLYPLTATAVLIFASNYFVQSNPLYIAGGFDVNKLQWKHEFGECVTDTNEIDERVKNCFIPKRLESKNVIFAVGDSHAAQITLMLQEFGRKKNQEVILFHSGDKPNSIHGFMRDDWKSSPRIFEELLKHGKENDTVVLTFASFHIQKATVSEIKKAEKVWSKYLKQLLSYKMNVILVLDSPYYQIFPIESCVFDSKFRSGTRCEMTKKEYLSQRKKQEVFFKSLITNFPEVRMWDMVDEFCTDKCSAIVDGKIEYFDYNHISKDRALKLEEGFSKFFIDAYGHKTVLLPK